MLKSFEHKKCVDTRAKARIFFKRTSRKSNAFTRVGFTGILDSILRRIYSEIGTNLFLAANYLARVADTAGAIDNHTSRGTRSQHVSVNMLISQRSTAELIFRYSFHLHFLISLRNSIPQVVRLVRASIVARSFRYADLVGPGVRKIYNSNSSEIIGDRKMTNRNSFGEDA